MKKLFSGVVFLLSCCVLTSVYAAGNITAGALAVKKYDCASCHGADFNTSIDPSYPKLAGQHADYLKHALIAYQRGSKDQIASAVPANTVGPTIRTNPIMNGQVKNLTYQEIADIAAYLASLKSTLRQ